MEDPNTLSFQSFNCRNDDDPFTLESLEGIDPKRIINIDGDCFDLKPLFNWVYNQEKMTNPLNRNTFGPETLERIKNAALKYFPCRVFIMNGNEVAASFKTTTLSTWERIFINAARKLYPSDPINTYRSALDYTASRNSIALENLPMLIEKELRSTEEAELLPGSVIIGLDPLTQEYVSAAKRVLALRRLPDLEIRLPTTDTTIYALVKAVQRGYVVEFRVKLKVPSGNSIESYLYELTVKVNEFLRSKLLPAEIQNIEDYYVLISRNKLPEIINDPVSTLTNRYNPNNANREGEKTLEVLFNPNNIRVANNDRTVKVSEFYRNGQRVNIAQPSNPPPRIYSGLFNFAQQPARGNREILLRTTIVARTSGGGIRRVSVERMISPNSTVKEFLAETYRHVLDIFPDRTLPENYRFRPKKYSVILDLNTRIADLIDDGDQILLLVLEVYPAFEGDNGYQISQFLPNQANNNSFEIQFQ